MDFANQGMLVGLARFDLAAGELPHSCKALAGRSPAAKILAIALDDGSNDSDGFHRHSLELVDAINPR